jgi:hypothetical protein
MDVPAIGKARGIFEIFVPGAFLLINLTIVLYLLSKSVNSLNILHKYLSYIVDQPGLIIIILVCFGYLIGMILRLFMTDIPDKLSAWYHRFFHRKKTRRQDGSLRSWSTEKFPYIECIGELILRDLCDKSSPIFEFYSKEWLPRKREKGNKRFFNFCKTMLLRQGNEMTVMELNTAESINRYISGMFYSLSLSFVLILCALPFQSNFVFKIISLCILISYFVGIWNIISRYRFIRLKEVQTLFDACYKNKDWFLGDCSKTAKDDM